MSFNGTIKPYNPRKPRLNVRGAEVDALKASINDCIKRKHDLRQSWNDANRAVTSELRAYKSRLKYALAKQKREWAEQDAQLAHGISLAPAEELPQKVHASPSSLPHDAAPARDDDPEFLRWEEAVWDNVQRTNPTTKEKFAAKRPDRLANFQRMKADGTLVKPGTSDAWA